MQEPPDAVGKVIRFGCGALFGAIVAPGFLYFLWLVPVEEKWMALAIGGMALLCGFLAMRWGDDFWTWVAEHSWWWFGR